MNFIGYNDKQIEAIKETEGPLLVIAGAGSGKTRVLTTRVSYLIQEKNVLPENILAITFTNKAAHEMKERINNILGLESRRIQISTFHSFGLLLIKQNYEKLGYTYRADSIYTNKKAKKLDGISFISIRYGPFNEGCRLVCGW
jgi:DNA helicase-2/ATP-dependent DNA helicase PcrA